MVPLQPNWPPLAPATGDPLLDSGVALAGVTVGAALAFHLYGRSLRGSDDPHRARARLARAVRYGFPLAYALAAAGMAAAGWFGLLNDAVGSAFGRHTGLGPTAATVAAVTAPAVAVLGAYLGTVPSSSTLRDGDPPSARARAGRIVRVGVWVVLCATALVVVVTTLNPETETGLGVPGTVAVLGALLLAGSPWLVRARYPTRDPTRAERERVERLCDDVGLAAATVCVLESDDAAGHPSTTAPAFLRGVPRRRHLFVTDALLSDLDDDRLRACLALGGGRARLLYPEARGVVVFGSVALAGVFAAGRVSLPGVGGAVAAAAVLGGGVAALWTGRRLVYRADADAARRTSREAVTETIRALVDLTDAPLEWGVVRALGRMEPPLARRITRVRTHTSA